MAAIITVPANVEVDLDAGARLVQYGEAVDQGMPLAPDVNNVYYQADCTTALNANAQGFAITPSAGEGWGYILTNGAINLGVAVTPGEPYMVGAVSGTVVPTADLVATNWVTQVGVGSTDGTQIIVNFDVTGQQRT